VLASSQQVLASALDRHAHGGGITAADYSRALAGLPPNGLIETFGNLSAVLSSPRAATARQIPWVAALRGYAASISASTSGISLQYKLDTTGAQLTSSQLPFAGGSTAPGFAGSMPIVFAIRDPSQVAAFLESTEQETSPAQYRAFLARQATARRKTGADLNTLLGLFTGDLIIDSDTHSTIGRVALSDPGAAKDALAKLASQPRAVFRTATTVTREPGGFYALKRPSGTITIGVVGDQLVVGQASPARLRAFATAPTTPAVGAKGALAFRIALADVVHLASKHPPSGLEGTIVRMLGDLTGWSAATPGAVTGSATMTFK
jgi:hypothetical protein